jgi:general secretion pathway protein D
MKKLRCLSGTLLCLMCVLAMPAMLVSAEKTNEEIGRIGRDNPFGEIMTTPVPVAAPQTQRVIEEKPDLALATVVPKFIDGTSLKAVLDNMVGPFGTVAVTEKNDAVIISDTPENLEKILVQIEKADRLPQQIMVEVVIIDVQLEDDTEIGINWDLLTDDRPNVVFRQSFSSARLSSTPENSETIGNATAFNTVGLGASVSLISGTVRHVLHMIQQKRDVEILANPRTLVLSGQSATLKAVEEIPYKELIDTGTGGANALSTTQFKEVGITLQVTGIIADANNIFLTVDTAQNVRTGVSADGVPVVDTRQATTSLMLQDGQVAIIGGLRRQEQTKEVRQVPLLGSVPIIGNLFKSTTKVTHNSELVVLLSPHVDKGAPVPASIATKYHAVRGGALLSGRDTGSTSDGKAVEADSLGTGPD